MPLRQRKPIFSIVLAVVHPSNIIFNLCRTNVDIILLCLQICTEHYSQGPGALVFFVYKSINITDMISKSQKNKMLNMKHICNKFVIFQK